MLAALGRRARLAPALARHASVQASILNRDMGVRSPSRPRSSLCSDARGARTAPSVHPIRRRPAANAPPGWCLLHVQANQWYLHFSREEGAELGAVKSAIQDFRATCADQGINVVLGFGPTLLPELTDEVPEDFQP